MQRDEHRHRCLHGASNRRSQPSSVCRWTTSLCGPLTWSVWSDTCRRLLRPRRYCTTLLRLRVSCSQEQLQIGGEQGAGEQGQRPRDAYGQR